MEIELKNVKTGEVVAFDSNAQDEIHIPEGTYKMAEPPEWAGVVIEGCTFDGDGGGESASFNSSEYRP